MKPIPPLLHWDTLDEAQREAVLARLAAPADPALESRVREIMQMVRTGGDQALKRLEEELDGAQLDSIEASSEEIARAGDLLTQAERDAIHTALENIRACHAAQRPVDTRVEPVPGVVCEQTHRPLQAVGLYVPAGTAPLPSTALMLAAPAQLAGCPLRVICTPPAKDGSANPAILYIAHCCEVHRVFKLGGAQAIAAMAHGTETVPRVDKIFGPGSRWVAAAKQQAAMEPGGPAQDLPAGPTEAMVIADESANPEFVALDLLSQAEHGEDAHVLLLCLEEQFAREVQHQIASQLRTLPRREVLEKSLSSGTLLVMNSLAAAFEVANRYAPEHLLLHVTEPRGLLADIRHAGAVFLGPWSPESAGDYCSGANHVLPTYGSARWASGLSLADFYKRISVQELSQEGLGSIAAAIATLARLEGLEGHARATEARRNKDRHRPGWKQVPTYSPATLAELIADDFWGNRFDHASRGMAASEPWLRMPEVVAAQQVRDADASKRAVRQFLTFTCAIDYQCNSDSLWRAAARLYETQPDLFDPAVAAAMLPEELHHDLREAGVAGRFPERNAKHWQRIAGRLASRIRSEVRRAIDEGVGCVDALRRDLKHFPLLRGDKIGAVWMRIMAMPGGARITPVEDLNVGVDIHIRRLTRNLGLLGNIGKIEVHGESRDAEVRRIWLDAASRADIAGPAGIGHGAGGLDPALWFFGRHGCGHCEKLARPVRFGRACDACRM